MTACFLGRQASQSNKTVHLCVFFPVASVVVYHQAMVVVVLLVCDSVSQLPLDSRSGHIK